MNRREMLRGVGAVGAAAYIAPWMHGQSDASREIHVDQVGYLPREQKLATLAAAADSFTVKRVRNGQVVLRGKPGEVFTDELSGDRVQVADWSAVRDAGEYVIEAGGERSLPVWVGEGVRDEALRLAMRSYYGQRCGCAVDLGGGYKHPACHLEGAFHASSGKSGEKRNQGGWHDAGDYGRYVVNSGISVATLLWAWEMYGDRLRGLKLDIPESAGKIPDFLAEVKWNLDWMLSLQDEDGSVWHKQTSEKFAPFVMPQDDHSVSYVIGTGKAPFKSTAATANVAACAAIAARCYGPYDDAFAKRCLEAAKRAYAWCEKNPAVEFRNPAGVLTGEYGGGNLADARLWAVAELWRTTGAPQYAAERFEAIRPIGVPGWNTWYPVACWTSAMSERKSPSRERIAETTAREAEAIAKRSESGGYGTTLREQDFVWGSNGVAMNQSLALLMAERLSGDKKWREAAASNLHYVLGRNCWGTSWVTGVGQRAFMRPHHRPSAADGVDAPWPGLMSGGPNRHPADERAKQVKAAPPMRMWVDATEAYSMNEVAINWNAPLVFVLAGLA